MTDDLRRVLDVLLHDLRTPLGVASGFVRMVKEGRLPAAETDRALEKTQEALRVMSGLCVTAGEWLQDHDVHPSSVPVRRFLAEVDTQLGGGVLPLTAEDATVTLGLQLDADAVARAAADLLRAVLGPGGNRDGLRVIVDAAALHLMVLAGAGAAPFDPWARPGLDAVLACRRIERAGGRWSSTPADGVALALTLPAAASGGTAR